jgi:RNA polymerase sigma-70 factor (ECF subfamily)
MFIARSGRIVPPVEDASAIASTATDSSGRDAFVQLTEPYRRQIKAHCYRMTGSLHEAEDLVQEAYLRAWRAFESFEGRGSLKSWLYQIATRVCLDAITQRKKVRRLLPETNFPPATEVPTGQPPTDIAWLEPYPDSEVDKVADEAPNAETQYLQRESVRLAFVAALQYLPPRQRAVLLLIDVLGWSSAETASLIGSSTASVNSALQRARSTLASRYTPKVPFEPLRLHAQSTLLERYVRVWEGKDLEGFVALLKEEATYAMPPWRHWYRGRDAIRNFFGTVWPRYGRFRLLPTRANGQPAFALYVEGKEGGWRAHSLQILENDGELISGLTLFMRPFGPTLFAAFGFPNDLENAPAVA